MISRSKLLSASLFWAAGILIGGLLGPLTGQDWPAGYGRAAFSVVAFAVWQWWSARPRRKVYREAIYFDPWDELSRARDLEARGYHVVQARKSVLWFREHESALPSIDAARARVGLGPLFRESEIERLRACRAS